MVVGTLRILPHPDRQGEVLEILRSVRGRVLAQPGCTACRIYEELGPERAVVLVERWDSAAAFEKHVRSEAFRRILGAVELSASTPEVRFDQVSGSAGLELVERVRGFLGAEGRERRSAEVHETADVSDP